MYWETHLVLSMVICLLTLETLAQDINQNAFMIFDCGNDGSKGKLLYSETIYNSNMHWSEVYDSDNISNMSNITAHSHLRFNCLNSNKFISTIWYNNNEYYTSYTSLSSEYIHTNNVPFRFQNMDTYELSSTNQTYAKNAEWIVLNEYIPHITIDFSFRTAHFILNTTKSVSVFQRMLLDEEKYLHFNDEEICQHQSKLTCTEFNIEHSVFCCSYIQALNDSIVDRHESFEANLTQADISNLIHFMYNMLMSATIIKTVFLLCAIINICLSKVCHVTDDDTWIFSMLCTGCSTFVNIGLTWAIFSITFQNDLVNEIQGLIDNGCYDNTTNISKIQQYLYWVFIGTAIIGSLEFISCCCSIVSVFYESQRVCIASCHAFTFTCDYCMIITIFVFTLLASNEYHAIYNEQ
eukprot:9116_1